MKLPMKKMILLPFAVTLLTCPAFAQKWEKSADRMWKGPIQKYYRLDERCQLMTSVDGSSWSISTDATWQDDEGKWFRLSGNTLAVSGDGKSWQPSSDGKWMGSDGNSYKLEDNCSLMVLRNATMGKSRFEQERIVYRDRLNKKLEELDTKIAGLRADAAKDPSVRSSLAKIEKNRDKLRSRLNAIGDTADSRWEELRKDLDTVMDENR
jgi:nuclear transport factor 2 (NTF2) superfamily protein